MVLSVLKTFPSLMNASSKYLMKRVKNDFFSKLIFNIFNIYIMHKTINHFQQKESKYKKLENLLLIYMTKMNMLLT